MILIDPPQGSLYGFPKRLPKEVKGDGAIKQFLLNNGYPDYLIDSGMKNCRYIGPQEELDALFS